MVRCIDNMCTFEVDGCGADSMLMCGDYFGCLRMVNIGNDRWAVIVTVPPGTHRVRYYVRADQTVIWAGEDVIRRVGNEDVLSTT